MNDSKEHQNAGQDDREKARRDVNVQTNQLRRVFLLSLQDFLIARFHLVGKIMDELCELAIVLDVAVAVKQPVRHNGVGLSPFRKGASPVVEFAIRRMHREPLGRRHFSEKRFGFLQQILVAGHMTIFLTRNQGWLWERPLPSLTLFVALETTQLIGTLAAVYGWLIEPVGWGYAMAIWGYSIIWMFINNAVKIGVLRLIKQVKHEPVYTE